MRHLQFIFIIAFLGGGGFALSSTVGGQDGNRDALNKISLVSFSSPSILKGHEFFGDLCADESFPAWENFVPTWQQNFQRRYRLWNGTELAGFAFSEECLSGCSLLGVSANIRQDEIAPPPFKFKNLAFKLTDRSLLLLKDEGIPEEVLLLLARLKDRIFENEPLFTDALHKLLGDEDLQEFREVILQHAYTQAALNSPWTLACLRKIDQQGASRQRDAWSDSLALYKKSPAFLAGDQQSRSGQKNANASEKKRKKSWLNKLRAFCDKWGLPRPRTLLLLLLLIYLSVSLIKNFVKAQQ